MNRNVETPSNVHTGDGWWRGAAALLALAVGLSASWLGGPAGIAYLAVFVAATVPGWPFGWAVFGRNHAAGWISGALVGYVFTALGIWTTSRLGFHSSTAFVIAWGALCLTSSLLLVVRGPLVRLAHWSRRDTAGLLLLLILVPALVGPPFKHIGAQTAEGVRLYRAYFTADFLWHMALTDELRNFRLPPANPYAADLTLSYYWTYFLFPAAVLETRTLPGLDVETALKLNALCAGLLFVSAIVIGAWRVAPRIGPVTAAVAVAVLAASAEGLYALWDLYSKGLPLSAVRTLNIDAITMWFWGGLTVDGLPRSLWYTPQHAMASGFGLVALVIAGTERCTTGAACAAGVALAGAVMVSPFLGGAFALIYGAAVVANVVVYRRPLVRSILPHLWAALLTVLAVLWCMANDMLTGTGGVLRLGFYGNARHAPVATLMLALGPLLVPALLGLWRVRRLPTHSLPTMAALLIGLGLFYFVSIGGTDPVWVGWRAGQILLVTLPGLAAVFLSDDHEWPRSQFVRAAVLLVVFIIGLPTTLIDGYNAQDVSNRAMGPGFPWTVTVGRAQQDAFDWIERKTPEDAVVQMEPTVRGRGTWSLIPSFAHRRMAAGLPISLVSMPYYEARSQRVRELYETLDVRQAWTIAHDLRIDYLYLDDVERQAFGNAAIGKFDRGLEYFRSVYRNEDVAIYAVGR